jgi:hypothetical protein
LKSRHLLITFLKYHDYIEEVTTRPERPEEIFKVHV